MYNDDDDNDNNNNNHDINGTKQKFVSCFISMELN